MQDDSAPVGASLGETITGPEKKKKQNSGETHKGRKGVQRMETGPYIKREDAITSIEAWARTNEDKSMRKPSTVARLIARRMESVRSANVDPICHSNLNRDFKGMKISYGVCGNCGKKLIWYTDSPIKGCPYCFFRLSEEKKKIKKEK